MVSDPGKASQPNKRLVKGPKFRKNRLIFAVVKPLEQGGTVQGLSAQNVQFAPDI